MNTTNKESKKSAFATATKNTFFRVLTFVGIIMCIGGVMFSVMNSGEKKQAAPLSEWNARAMPSQDDAIEKARIRELTQKLSEKGKTYQATLKQEQAQFRKELAEIIASGKSKTLAGIPKAIDNIIDNGVSLVRAMATDMVRDSKDTEDKISEILDPHFTSPMLKSKREAETLLSAYILRTKEIANRYTAEVGGIIRDLGEYSMDSSEIQALERANAASIQKITKAGTDIGFATVGIGTELILAKSSIKLIKTAASSVLKRALSVPAKRAATTIAVSGGCAVADGPLPIGDIAGGLVAIGGTAWALWDLYDAYDTIENELPQELSSQASAFFNELHTSVEKRAGEWEKNLPKPLSL